MTTPGARMTDARRSKAEEMFEAYWKKALKAGVHIHPQGHYPQGWTDADSHPDIVTSDDETRDLIGEIKRQMDCRTEITTVGFPHVLIDGRKILSVIDTLSRKSQAAEMARMKEIELQEVQELLHVGLKIVQAQMNLLAAYRTGGRPKESALKVLDGRDSFISNATQILGFK